MPDLQQLISNHPWVVQLAQDKEFKLKEKNPFLILPHQSTLIPDELRVLRRSRQHIFYSTKVPCLLENEFHQIVEFSPTEIITSAGYPEPGVACSILCRGEVQIDRFKEILNVILLDRPLEGPRMELQERDRLVFLSLDSDRDQFLSNQISIHSKNENEIIISPFSPLATAVHLSSTHPDVKFCLSALEKLSACSFTSRLDRLGLQDNCSNWMTNSSFAVYLQTLDSGPSFEFRNQLNKAINNFRCQVIWSPSYEYDLLFRTTLVSSLRCFFKTSPACNLPFQYKQQSNQTAVSESLQTSPKLLKFADFSSDDILMSEVAVRIGYVSGAELFYQFSSHHDSLLTNEVLSNSTPYSIFVKTKLLKCFPLISENGVFEPLSENRENSESGNLEIEKNRNNIKSIVCLCVSNCFNKYFKIFRKHIFFNLSNEHLMTSCSHHCSVTCLTTEEYKAIVAISHALDRSEMHAKTPGQVIEDNGNMLSRSFSVSCGQNHKERQDTDEESLFTSGYALLLQVSSAFSKLKRITSPIDKIIVLSAVTSKSLLWGEGVSSRQTESSSIKASSLSLLMLSVCHHINNSTTSKIETTSSFCSSNNYLNLTTLCRDVQMSNQALLAGIDHYRSSTTTTGAHQDSIYDIQNNNQGNNNNNRSVKSTLMAKYCWQLTMIQIIRNIIFRLLFINKLDN